VVSSDLERHFSDASLVQSSPRRSINSSKASQFAAARAGVRKAPVRIVEAEAQKIDLVDWFDQMQKLRDTKSVLELEDKVLKFDTLETWLLSMRSSPSGIYSPAPFSEDAVVAGMQEETEETPTLKEEVEESKEALTRIARPFRVRSAPKKLNL